MPLPFRPLCLPTHLGPLPHSAAQAAWEAVLHATPLLPALPILNGAGESLAGMSIENFAGVTAEDTAIVADRVEARRGLDALYAGYLRGTALTQAVDLACMPRLLPSEQTLFRRARALWALVLGPISLALTAVDEQRTPLLGDSELLDAIAKHLFLRRHWLHTTLGRMGKPTIAWIYEPYFEIMDSPFCPLPAEELLDAIDQALGQSMPRALWTPSTAAAMRALPRLNLDVIGLPLPSPEDAAQLAPLLKQALSRRTTIGWGVVPVTEEGLRATSAGRLAARFEAWLRALDAAGLPNNDLVIWSMIMPDDVLAYLDQPGAEQALTLTAQLSSLIQQSYGVE